MRILLFIETFMSPTLSFIYNEVQELSKQHQVKIITTKRINGTEFPFADVEVIPFRQNKLEEKIQWYLEKYDISFSKKNKKFADQLNALIRSYKPDIIHAHFGYEALKLYDNIDKVNVPAFLTFHGYDASVMISKRSYVSKLNELFLKHNISPLCVSGYMIDDFIKNGINIENAKILNCGINVDFYSPPENIPARKKYTFLQVSSFVEKKGHIYTLTAFRKFLDTKKDKENYELILAGGWGFQEEIKQVVVQMGLSDRVSFPGPLGYNQCRDFLSNANVFLHHSIVARNGDKEGIPNAIMEAMAMELPVISTYHSGIPELVEDGVNGYLVAEKDVATYAQRMNDVLEWPRLPLNRQKIVEKFSRKIHDERLNEIYSNSSSDIKFKNTNLLHLFNNYPGGNTLNWLHGLLINIPNVNTIIAAKKYTKNNFYKDEFRYIDNPLSSITQYKEQLSLSGQHLIDKFFCFIAEKLIAGLQEKLEWKLKEMKIDLVHAHFADIGCEFVDLIKKMNLPMVISFYGYDYEYLPHIKPAYIKKYKELFSKGDKFICEGNNGANLLKKMGCPANKIEVVRLGVAVEKIVFKERKKNTGSLRLVQIASLREKKGHIYALKAFHAALSECPNMHLTFVGIGEEEIKNQLHEYVLKNSLEKKVTMLREVEFSELHKFLDDFDVCIHPSCYSSNMDCEGGAPIILLDAQACGMPVISTTHCDIPDEVIHLQTGLLTPEKDVDSLAVSVKYFYNMDNGEYQRFSHAARKHVEENYSIVKNAIKLKEVYSNLLSKKEFSS